MPERRMVDMVVIHLLMMLPVYSLEEEVVPAIRILVKAVPAVQVEVW
jgi:hypothetical protein